MKNIEKIKNMGTWEFAEFLKDVSDNVREISVCDKKCKECTYSDCYCTSQIAEWLFSEDKNEI